MWPAIMTALLIWTHPDVGHARLKALVNNPEIAEKIGLTDVQRDTLAEIFYSTEEDMISLKSELERQKLKLRRLLSQENPDEKEILKVAERIGEIRKDMKKRELREVLAVRKVLTKEQWNKLRKIRKTPPPLRRLRKHRPPERDF